MKRLIFSVVSLLFVVAATAQKEHSESLLKEDDKLIIFEKLGKVMDGNSYQVFDVLKKGYALARTQTVGFDGRPLSGSFHGAIVLLYEENKYFYNDEIVTVPANMEDRQIGIYQYDYSNYEERYRKTAPVIQFRKKTD